MAIEGFNNIQLDGIFSKGCIMDKGEYTMGVEYSPDAQNIRIINGVTTGRKGYVTKIRHGSGTSIKGITGANGSLYVGVNSKIMKADFTTNTLVDIGASGAAYGSDTDVNFVQYGKKLIVLTGAGYPYVYDIQANTWTQLTSSNIISGANPIMGVSFSRMTIVVGNGTGYKNTAFLSRGILPTNPEYAHDWFGTGSEQLLFNSDIITIVTNLSKVYVFTEATVEQFTQDTLTTIGGSTASYTIPVSTGNQPAGRRAVIAFDDKVFFFARNKQIKSINFVPNVTDPQIGKVSERQNQSIRNFFNTLDDDQSQCVAVANKEENTVEFHVRSKGSPVNDRTIVYDITNDTMIPDTNKFYSCVTEMNDKLYAGSCLNTSIINDNSGYDDDGQNIPRYRYTKKLHFGNLNIRKKVAEWGTIGEITPNGRIGVEVIADGKTVYRTEIKGMDGVAGGYGAVPIGGAPTGGEGVEIIPQPFEYVIPKGKLYEKCKHIQVLYKGLTPGMQFALSTAYVAVKGLGDLKIEDKI